MIFGRTDKEAEQRRKRIYQWHPAFAWWPSVLLDGRIVWLEEVERIHYLASCIDMGAHRSFWNSWCYRLPPDPSEG